MKCFLRGRESSRKGEGEKPAERNGRDDVSEGQRIRVTKQRGFREGDPVWEIIRSCKQSGRRGASKTKRGMENLRLVGFLTPTSRASLTPSQLHQPVPPLLHPGGGRRPDWGQTALQWCAGAGLRWLLLVCRRQLGNIWEFCKPVVSSLKLALVGVFIP